MEGGSSCRKQGRDLGLVDLLYEVLRVSATALDDETQVKNRGSPHEELASTITALELELELTKKNHSRVLSRVEECIKAELIQKNLDDEEARLVSEELKQKNEDLRQQIAELRDELEETRTKHAHTLAEIESRIAAELVASQRTKRESELRIEQLENSLRSLNASTYSDAHEISNAKTKNLEAQTDALKEYIELLSEEVLSHKSANVRLSEQCESVGRARDDAEARMKEMQKDLQELSVVEAGLTSSQQARVMLERKVATLQESALASEKRAQEVVKILSGKDQQLHLLQEMWETSRRSQEMTAREMVVLRAELSAERSAMATELTLLRSEAETLRLALTSSSSTVSSLQRDLEDNYQRLEVTQDTLSQRDEEIVVLQERNDRLNAKVRQLEEMSDAVMKRLIGYQSAERSASPSSPSGDDEKWRAEYEDVSMELLKAKKTLTVKEEELKEKEREVNEKDELLAMLRQNINDKGKKTPPLTPLRATVKLVHSEDEK